MPHLVQNLAFGLSCPPHETQFPQLCCGGSNEGSGVGRVPGWLNASLVPITEGGPPTGLSAVPERGGTPPGWRCFY